MDWWYSRIEDLCGAKQEVAKLYEMVRESLPQSKTYEKGPWVFMKLLLVAMYIDIYTNIAKKWFNRIVYIDLFSGPGFNRVEKLDELLAGSPLLAQIMPRVLKSGEDKAFDEMLLFDIDEENCETLRRVVHGNALVVCCDANSEDAVTLIMATMQREPRSHYLAFVDPEGTQVKWSTLEVLFELDGDLIINYPYSGVARLVGGYHGTEGSAKESIGQKLTEFFGTQEWIEIPKDDGMGELLFNLYLSRVKLNRSKVVVIPIPSEVGGFQYRIVIATKKTGGNSPWLRPMEKAREKLETMTHKQLKRLVDIYRERQDTLDKYF